MVGSFLKLQWHSLHSFINGSATNSAHWLGSMANDFSGQPLHWVKLASWLALRRQLPLPSLAPTQTPSSASAPTPTALTKSHWPLLAWPKATKWIQALACNSISCAPSKNRKRRQDNFYREKNNGDNNDLILISLCRMGNEIFHFIRILLLPISLPLPSSFFSVGAPARSLTLWS